MNKRKHHGRVVAELLGYKVRQLMDSKDEKNVPTGKFGIYRGNKKRHDLVNYNSKEEAITFIKTKILK